MTARRLRHIIIDLLTREWTRSTADGDRRKRDEGAEALFGQHRWWQTHQWPAAPRAF